MGWLGRIFKSSGRRNEGLDANEGCGEEEFSKTVATFEKSVAEAAEIVSREFNLRDSGELARRRHVPTMADRSRAARRTSLPDAETGLPARNSLEGELTPIEPQREEEEEKKKTEKVCLKGIGGRISAQRIADMIANTMTCTPAGNDVAGGTVSPPQMPRLVLE